VAGTQIQYRRGSQAQNDAFTGALGEITVDTTNKTLRVHDGTTVGGNTIATTYATQTLSFKTLSAPSVTGTLSSTGLINTTANISAAILNSGAINSTGFINTSGNVSAAILNSGAINSTGLINTIGNILSTGLSVFGNTRIGSLATPGALHTIIGNVDVSGAGTEYFNIGGNIMAIQGSFGSINSTGLINTSGNIICASISAGTYVGLSSSKINTNASNVTVDSSYVNVAINGSNIASIGAAGIMPTANASGSLGSTTVRWNNIVGVSGNFLSVNANYADLAEIYTSDQQYPAGTVLVFGGESEVTHSSDSHDTRIAGVVSTNPAYLMNGAESGIPVALQGRVPCRVLGPVSKGDRVVASHIAGVAQALDPQQYQPGCIIGKALQAIDSTDISTIEVVVGRL